MDTIKDKGKVSLYNNISYEKYIQYLYGIISNLESQRETDIKAKPHCIAIKELQSLKNRLKNSEKLCNEKEKFILFREEQLSNIYEETENKINKLKYRIQKLRETIILERQSLIVQQYMTHLPSTNTPVFNLITDVRANIKLLADSARGDNTFLKNEIDNFQAQAELGLTKIQNRCYTFENEVTQLRQEVINLRDINLNQQELTNELDTINETFKERIDDLTNKNETFQSEINEKTRLYEQVQDRLDECREENYQLRESLEGAHENITESEFVYDKLKQKLRILGLTHVAW
ncbi:hypothetical protein Glove_341g55 [Diversispora epigaea]|uniref:Uncharacterized protein n=1 Tax=Diversispora epigaea TaxID=1348612 RepID=A0A397HGJ8_9GLOM|nr:hypothetical protein Glove_341g51 [Diversispora epigaea]RHZ62255.1 hypothetical protein Glove_341g55 [Diversispora epigaea]